MAKAAAKRKRAEQPKSAEFVRASDFVRATVSRFYEIQRQSKGEIPTVNVKIAPPGPDPSAEGQAMGIFSISTTYYISLSLGNKSSDD
jgi:hypothetical protein